MRLGLFAKKMRCESLDQGKNFGPVSRNCNTGGVDRAATYYRGNRFQILFSSGNIASGVVRIYGIQ
jgi:hypothetical protein